MLMDLGRFKRQAQGAPMMMTGPLRGKRVPIEATLRKDYAGPAVILADRQLRFTISSAAVDRTMDVIDQGGWDLAAYRLNPVVLFQHSSWDFPIGKCVDIGLEGGDLRATVEFAPADMPSGTGELAETVLRMCRQGFLSATSVGFRPLDYEVSTDPARSPDDWYPGFDFKRQELLEFSVVTIPCNPEAVIDPQHRDQPGATAADMLATLGLSPAGRKAARRLAYDRRFAPG